MGPLELILSLTILKKIYRRSFVFIVILLPIIYLILHGALINLNVTLVEISLCQKSMYIYGYTYLAFLVPRSEKTVYFGKFQDIDVVFKKIKRGYVCPANLPDETCSAMFGGRLEVNGEQIRNIVLCPTVIGVDDLIKDDARSDLKHIANEHFVEPLLLQLLRAEEGWSVPKYFGRCDNTIIEEYIGKTLSRTELSSWSSKVKIAASLLHLADQFTFQHENFSFYFTDLSPDNLAVTPEFRVVIIDLDNVIIVDRREKYVNDGLKSEWKILHESTLFEDNVFTFSSVDICRHQYSDHNFYAVCAFLLAHSDILSQGVLQDIPDEASELSKYLQECVKPRSLSSRIVAGRELLKLLQEEEL